MNSLEDRLRESLRYRATLPRLAEDVATTAIQGARTHRRRQFTLVAAATILIAAIVAGATTLGGPTSAPPIPPASPATPTPALTPPSVVHGLDVLDGTQLISREGRRYQLGAKPGWIYRMRPGWLYGQFNGPAILLRDDGTTIVLSQVLMRLDVPNQPVAPVPAADGYRIAWEDNGMLHAGRLTEIGIDQYGLSPVPDESFAATWIGDRVVVGNTYATSSGGGSSIQFDVWDPTKGNFVPQWTKDLFPVYGPVPPGVPAFASLAVDPALSVKGCLARVDGVASMAVTAQACVPDMHAGSLTYLLSPDGRFLIDRDGTDRLVTFALGTVVQNPVGYHPCPGRWPLAFEDATTYLAEVENTKQLFRCHIDSDQVEEIPLTETPVQRYGY